MTDDERAEARRVCEAATKGWRIDAERTEHRILRDLTKQEQEMKYGVGGFQPRHHDDPPVEEIADFGRTSGRHWSAESYADAAFCVAARTALPELLNEHDRLARENETLRKALHRYRSCRHACIDCFCTREARAAMPSCGRCVEGGICVTKDDGSKAWENCPVCAPHEHRPENVTCSTCGDLRAAARAIGGA